MIMSHAYDKNEAGFTDIAIYLCLDFRGHDDGFDTKLAR